MAPCPLVTARGPDGRYAIYEPEAEVVREIFRKVSKGTPFVDIANSLNGRGIHTKRGGLWGKNSFHAILHNEAYIGVYHYSDVRGRAVCRPSSTKPLSWRWNSA